MQSSSKDGAASRKDNVQAIPHFSGILSRFTNRSLSSRGASNFPDSRWSQT
jgi:hypothetical protein